MNIRRGRVVRTSSQPMAYKVVLESSCGQMEEHSVSTIREGEAYIREVGASYRQGNDELMEWNGRASGSP